MQSLLLGKLLPGTGTCSHKAYRRMLLCRLFLIVVVMSSVQCFALVWTSNHVRFRSANLYAIKPAPRHPDTRKPVEDFRGSISNKPLPKPKPREFGSHIQDSLRQTWKTGETLVRTQPNQARKSRRNDPWWMRDEERLNPAILPAYRPWWAMNYQPVESGMKLNELREIARARGIRADGSKNDLLHRLQQQERLNNLQDSNFRAPEFSDTILSVSDSCYPESYEGARPQ
jgi:hypothetical protein